MRHGFYILLLIQLIACNNNNTSNYSGYSKPSDTGKIISTNVVDKSFSDISGCYMKIIGQDTAILMLEPKDKELSGKMIYDNYEKDGSRGSIKGKEQDGILKLWYDFESEGMHSVTEVYFKKEKGKLLRGVGGMEVKTDTAYYVSGINYSDKETFVKIDCGLVDWKLKF